MRSGAGGQAGREGGGRVEKARGRQASGEVYYTAVTLLRCADGWEWLGAHRSGDLAGQLEESGINQTVARAEADDGRRRRSKQALRPTHGRTAPAALRLPPRSTSSTSPLSSLCASNPLEFTSWPSVMLSLFYSFKCRCFCDQPSPRSTIGSPG